MRLLIGTAQGAFLANGADPTPALGLDGRNLRHLSRAGGAVLAGADSGLFRSTDAGRTFAPSGLEGRFVWDVAQVGDALYAVTQPAELHVSRDGGRSWTEIEAFRRFPGAERWCVPITPPLPGRARTMAIDPVDPRRWWIGVEVGGVAVTSDAGARWSMSLPYGNPDPHVVVAHPGKPGVLFASTGLGRLDDREPMQQRIGGVFRSDDGGRSWQYTWKPSMPRYTRPMCIDPRAPHAVTVGSGPTAFSSHRDPDGANAELYQTTDEGRTWQRMGDPAHSPSRANLHVVAPDPETAGGVLVGTDTGEVWQVSPEAKWTLLAEGLPQVQAVMAL
ncbi:MAG TPA: hypothetical protein VEL75_07475 [Candidatus Methylomirabilis sp.]|nr:hypothetical protein [Candidatus Methylomirabilis sp.]